MSEPVNVNDLVAEPDPDDPEGYHTSTVRVGPLIGAERLGATIFEMPEGQSNCPYHYEFGREEMAFVISGHPVLRAPDGEHRLEPGDVVLFPEGPEGAHKLTNPDPEPARVMIMSNSDDPGVAIYPDSDKIGIWPPGLIFRQGDAVDYWDGELEPPDA